VQNGFLVRSDDTSATLKLPTGQAETIGNDQIKDRQRQAVSLMPEGLLQGLTEQEAADLIAYLAGAK
jgi:putative heme-binding domain-containing protein